jgi:hypothetical protein
MNRYVDRLLLFLVIGPAQFAFPPEFDPFSSELVSPKVEGGDEDRELDTEYGPEPAWDPAPPGEKTSDELSETGGPIIEAIYGDGGGDGLGDGGDGDGGGGDGCS